MTGSKDEIILNSLIATTLDSVDGYRKAGEQADNQRLRSIFNDRANEREQVVRKLQESVRTAGGNPEDDGTVLAGAHRVFLSLRDAVTGDRDDDAIVAEVERGEDYIKGKFDTALNDTDLSPEARTVVSGCYDSVRAGHDQMSNLKHGMQAS